MGGHPLNAPVVGMAAQPDGRLLAGCLRRRGLLLWGALLRLHGRAPLNAPIVGIAATPDGDGYYLVAADGGVFTFGDAHFRRLDGR